MTSPMPTIEGAGQRIHLGHRLQVEQRPELARVPDHALAQDHDGGDHHVLEIGGVEEGLAPGVLARLTLGLDLLVDRRLFEVGPHVHGDEHQQERAQERDAPGPVVERGFAEVGAGRDDDDERQHDAEGRRGLQPAGIVTALVFRHVLGDISDGAAVRAAQAEPLDHAQAEQDDRGAQTDLLEGRDQSDRAGAESHADERQNEGVLAADAVSHPAEHERPQRTDQEAGGEQRDRAEQSGDGVALIEELDRQDRGQAAENIEIIPFDDVASRRGCDDASEVCWNTGSGHGVSSPCCLPRVRC